jgi:Na+-driven multidrug efflux pump
MVSNIIGQGKQDNVIELVYKIIRISLLFSVSLAILLNIYPGVFLSIFGQGVQFAQEALPVIRVVSVALVLMSFSTIWLNAVTGTGNTDVNLLIEIITALFYCLYVFFVLEYFNLPLSYGWMSEWVYWLLTFGMSFFYLKSGKWKKKII